MTEGFRHPGQPRLGVASGSRVPNRIQHPGVVDVIDPGETEAGLPHLVMEYLRGQTPCERLSRGRIELPELLEVVRTVLQAYAAACDAAPKCAALLAGERAPWRAWRQADEDLRDVRFQID